MNVAILVGQVLTHQFLQLEIDPQGALVSISGSNALQISVGSL